VVFRFCLWAFILAFKSIGNSDTLNPDVDHVAPPGGLSTRYQIRINQNTEAFIRNCDSPTPPIFDPQKWCKVPPGWDSNPGDIEEGRTATEIWQATGRCTKGHKFNAATSKCVSKEKTACTWGQKFNSLENTCETINADDKTSPSCEIKGFNSEQNGTGQWFSDKIPISTKRVFAFVTCKKQQDLSFIPICNIKNTTNNSQTNWYKCMGPDPLNQKSFWIEVNLSEISEGEKDNQIIFEIRGAYSKTPLMFHESKSKSFLYKI
jgi:hypothetical protein